MPPQKRKHSDKMSHTIISSDVARVDSKVSLSANEANPLEPIISIEDEVPGPSKKSVQRRKSRSRSRNMKKV